MTDYEPGTVAVATVRGVKGVRVFRLPGASWATGRHTPGAVGSWRDIAGLSDVTDIRPLVVLDPEDYEQVNGLVQMSEFYRPGAIVTTLTKSLQRGLRSLVKPPRIPEPGLWGVVEARTTVLPLRDQPRPSLWVNHSGRWMRAGDGVSRAWADLIDPVLVREGISA